ncbi:hypothetical protein RPD76_04635 [Methylomonas sp. MV1]|uniref:hypothetical protein n=1 Tax=Methylomonas sp. MV1 TaxID=3073620 RepID=UPI0028A3F4E8|nr:hypothetical protein [Methylomonas sp. MV1]MDT4329181.1 hypothetical protein [Methylomonas sp. MV1]
MRSATPDLTIKSIHSTAEAFQQVHREEIAAACQKIPSIVRHNPSQNQSMKCTAMQRHGNGVGRIRSAATIRQNPSQPHSKGASKLKAINGGLLRESTLRHVTARFIRCTAVRTLAYSSVIAIQRRHPATFNRNLAIKFNNYITCGVMLLSTRRNSPQR